MGQPALTVRRAAPADARAWVACYLDALEAAYAVLMPAEFGPLQRGRESELVDDKRASFDPDPEAPTRGWVAEADGLVVAVAQVSTAPTRWEGERGLPPPSTSLQLEKLYSRPSALGSGVGQALLDTAVGDRAAYLWLVDGNARAASFYRRNGFGPDGVETTGGPSWFGRRMVRLHRG
ncbi:GNAT family N-acetyltransferase [Dermatophilaceae bacterium Soc4.6]